MLYMPAVLFAKLLELFWVVLQKLVLVGSDLRRLAYAVTSITFYAEANVSIS